MSDLTTYDIAEAIAQAMASGDVDNVEVTDMEEPSATPSQVRFAVEISHQWFTVTVEKGDNT